MPAATMIRPSAHTFATWTLVLLSSASIAFAQKGDQLPPHPADPYADPKNDIYNPLRYIASNALTAVSFSAFSRFQPWYPC